VNYKIKYYDVQQMITQNVTDRIVAVQVAHTIIRGWWWRRG